MSIRVLKQRFKNVTVIKESEGKIREEISQKLPKLFSEMKSLKMEENHNIIKGPTLVS